MNSIDAKIRKQQSILMCSGLAMILFGVWSIARFILLRFVDIEHYYDYFEMLGVSEDKVLLNIVLVFVLFAMLLDLCLRTYIGVSAINEGLGNYKKRATYIIIALICLVTAVAADVADIISLIKDEFSLELFYADIIDITIHIATLEVVISAIKLRKYKKEIEA